MEVMVVKIGKEQVHLCTKVLICLQLILFAGSFNYCMKVLQVKFLHDSSIPNAIYIYAFIFLFFIFGVVPQIIHKMKLDIIFLVLFLVVIYLISFAKNGAENIFFDNTIIWTFGNGVVSYAIVRYIEDWKNMCSIYSQCSRIILILMVISWWISKDSINYSSSPEWYMFFSTALLLPILGVFILYEEKRKLQDLTLAIMGIYLVFMYGARGTLVQIIVFLLLYYTMSGKYLEGGGKFLIGGVTLISALKYIYGHVNISNSRTLSLLINNAIGETDRIVAWKRMLTYFNEQPLLTKLFGLGLAGERMYIYKNIYKAGYPHNIIIEQLLQLGIIGFSILALVVVSLTIRTVICTYKTEYSTIISLFGAYFVVLFFSNSYLTSNHFFIWVAMCMGIMEKNVKERSNQVMIRIVR